MRGGGSKRLRALPLVLAGAILASSCTRPPAETRPSPGPDVSFPSPVARSQIRIAVGPITSLDPAHLDTPDSLLVAAQVFDSLIDYAPQTLEVRPSAAREWEIEEEGRVFRFHLRGGARFHDGTPVRARDFIRAWNRLADPGEASPYAFLLEAVRGFRQVRRNPAIRALAGLEAPDDRTLIVRLARPWPDFVSVLGHPALSPVPPGAVDPRFGDEPAGNGPYRLERGLGSGTSILLERFFGYPGPAPRMREAVLRLFDDPVEAWPEFLAGDLDIATIPPALVAEAEAAFGSDGILVLSRLLYCGFNLDLARFQDPALRRAVSLGVDRESLVAGVYGAVAVPATGIVPPGIPGHDPDACGSRCEHHPERARSIVDALPPETRSFVVDFADSAVGERVAAAIVAQLEAIGLTVRPRPHPEREFSELFRKREGQFFCLTWVAEYPRQQASLEPLLLAGSPDNRTGVDDRVLERLLGEGRAADAPFPRREAYAVAEGRALDLMPLVPLAWFRSHLAVQEYVKNFALSPNGRFDVSRLVLDPS